MIISLGDDPKIRSEKAGDMGQKRQNDKKTKKKNDFY